MKINARGQRTVDVNLVQGRTGPNPESFHLVKQGSAFQSGPVARHAHQRPTNCTLIYQKYDTSKVIHLVHRWNPTSVPRSSAGSRPKATSLLAPRRLQIDCARTFARIAATGHRRALPAQQFPSP